MASADLTIDLFVELLKKSRLSINTEHDCKNQMAGVLKANGIRFVTEYVLDARSRLDFYLEGTAVEVKLKGSRMEIYKQCERYCAHPAVKDLVLATNRAMNMPLVINGKRVIVMNLGKAWL